MRSSGLIGQSEQAMTADLGQDKVLGETSVDDVDQSGTHQRVDAFADQLQSSPARTDPHTEDPIELGFLLMFFSYFPHVQSFVSVQGVTEAPIEIQDKLSDDSQQNIDDQPQLPITEVPESSLAKNSTSQTQATLSTAEVNLLVSLNFFLALFGLFTLYLQVPTTSSLIIQSGLVTFLPDDVKAKLIEVLPLLNRDIDQLVQDVEPIKTIFKQIQGQLP
jgi:microcystin-dependent protein